MRTTLTPVDLLGDTPVHLTSSGTGCDLHNDCESCPFVLCQFDLPEPDLRESSDRKRMRWAVVALVFLDDIDDRKSDEEIAEQFSTTVYNASLVKQWARWIRDELEHQYEEDEFAKNLYR